jgi:hypothetical protein
MAAQKQKRGPANMESMATITFEDLEKLIRFLPPRLCIMLHGPPGIGKSAWVLNNKEILGEDIEQIGLATRQPEDISGIPYPNKEEKTTEFLVLDWFKRFSKAGPNGPDPKGCVFFDEYDKGDESKQVAVMRILSERTLEGWELGDNVRIILAANREEDNAGSYHDMPRVVRNRLVHFEIAPSYTYWKKKYAEEVGHIHPLVTLFLDRHPDLFCAYNTNTNEWGFPTARSWTAVSDILHAQDAGLSDGLAFKAIVGAIGGGAAAQFEEFRKYMTEIPPISELANGNASFPPKDRPDHWVALVARCIAAAEQDLIKTPPDHRGLKNATKVMTMMEMEEFKLLLATYMNRRKLTRKLWAKKEVVGAEVSKQIGSILHKIRERSDA